MKRILFAILITAPLSLIAQISIQTDLSEQGTEISQELIGVFFEDINYAADGGLYAELIQNRSFEYYPVAGYVDLDPLHAWKLVEEGGASAGMSIQNSDPLNSNNTRYLNLEISTQGNLAGISNSGYSGIPIEASETYNYSVYIKCIGDFTEPVVAKIKNASGVVIASDTIKNINTSWTKYSGVLTSASSTLSGAFQLDTKGLGILQIDMVSLFPENTYKNRKNGLRKDIAEVIEELQPKFLRFPGGCISHGRGIENTYLWKETIGDVAERAPNWNLWGYHQTYGLGFFEYFQFCEDINAIPLPVLPVGVTCQFRNREIVPLEDMEPYINDALDLVEFANGDVSTIWGAKRAEMGHPEPFNMEYVCLGNEEDDIPEFRLRFKMIADSLKKYHPEIKVIGTSGTSHSGSHYDGLWEFNREEDVAAVDEHYYVEPSWLINNNHRYDQFSRTGPKVFIGEYASKDDRMLNAIAEASYLTGVERNGDVIQFTCYAPLLCREGNQQWHPDLIRFDNTRVMKTANYYVQQLYSLYSGETTYGVNYTYQDGTNPNENIYKGQIGVGSWNTTAEFDDVQVKSGDKVWVDEDFSAGSANWQVLGGTFNVSNGIYVQNSYDTPAWSVYTSAVDTSVYTYTLKVRKTSGAEGFLIPFGLQDSNNFYWLNLGGWNNSTHAIEHAVNGGKSTLVSKSGTILNNVWYDIKIEVNGSSAVVYLNNDVLFTIPAPEGPITASIVKNEANKEVIVKVANTEQESYDLELDISGVNILTDAKVITLEGDPALRNTINNPELVKPVESSITGSNKASYLIPAHSFSVFIFNYDNATGLDKIDHSREEKNNLSISPNPSINEVIVYLGDKESNGTLTVCDLSGKVVCQKQVINKNEIRLPRANMKSGTYLVQFTSVSGKKTAKLVWQD